MKIKGLKSVLGIAFLMAAGLVISQYQNCAPAGTTGAFILSSNQSASNASTSATNNGSGIIPVTTAALVVSSITLPSASVQVSTSLSATAVVTNGAPMVHCSWSVVNSAPAVVATYVSTSSTGVCSLTFAAPAAAANYTLSLTVSDSTLQSATSTVRFTTQAAPVATTFSASLTPSPLGGIYDTTPFTLTAAAVATTPQIFRVVIGTTIGGSRTPIPGCTFTSTTPATSYTPACTTYFTIIGTTPLYVDVTVGTQTLDCALVSASCSGTYSVAVRTGGGGGGGNK